MKRSRIFLGLTTGLLAIAGIAAAKANRASIKPVFYYTSASKAVCTAAPQGNYTKTRPSGASQALYLSTYLLYTQDNCTIPAYFNAQ